MAIKEYVISENLAKELLEVLSNYTFSDGGHTNNDDVIEVRDRLLEETKIGE